MTERILHRHSPYYHWHANGYGAINSDFRAFGEKKLHYLNLKLIAFFTFKKVLIYRK